MPDKRLIAESYRGLTGQIVREDITDHTPAESNLGKFFFPSGKEKEFGQLIRMELTYSNGDIRTYYVEVDD